MRQAIYCYYKFSIKLYKVHVYVWISFTMISGMHKIWLCNHSRENVRVNQHPFVFTLMVSPWRRVLSVCTKRTSASVVVSTNSRIPSPFKSYYSKTKTTTVHQWLPVGASYSAHVDPVRTCTCLCKVHKELFPRDRRWISCTCIHQPLLAFCYCVFYLAQIEIYTSSIYHSVIRSPVQTLWIDTFIGIACVWMVNWMPYKLMSKWL